MATRRTIPSALLVTAWILGAPVPPGRGQEPPDWCPMEGMADPPCTRGPCDDPAERDRWIPGPSTPVMKIRLKFNVFGEDDGSVFAATEEQVNWQVYQLNQGFEPYGIRFEHDTQLIPNSRFFHFCSDVQPGDCGCLSECPDDVLLFMFISPSPIRS